MSRPPKSPAGPPRGARPVRGRVPAGACAEPPGRSARAPERPGRLPGRGAPCLAAVLALSLVALAGCAGGRSLALVICGDLVLPSASSVHCLPPEEVTEQPEEDDVEVTVVAVDVSTEAREVVYHTTADMCAIGLPFTVEVSEGYETVNVEVSAWGPAGTIRATARPSFPTRGVRELHVGLSRDCLNVRCAVGRTCVGGVCELVGAGWDASACR